MADVKITALPAGTAQPTGILPVVNGGVTQRITVKNIVDLAMASVPAGTIDTIGNTSGITEGADLPIDQILREVVDKAAYNNYGAAHSLLSVTSDLWAPGSWGGDGTITAGGVAAGEMLTGTLYYGALIDLKGRAVQDTGYVLPLPTQQGYLRADQDPASGWYFAEPVVVSDTAPPTPPGDPALPMLWIDPNGDPPITEFTNVTPPVYRDSIITEQANGLPIGLDQTGTFFYQPDIVGGIPILVDGKRYLLPVIEAPANKMTQTLPEPMFVFKDPMTTQQSDGTYIGLDPTGQFVTQPNMVGAIPVLVNGVRYMLPLIEE